MKKYLNNLFTVGCSTHSSESFIEILKKNQVNAIADVRSNPYSRHTPQFNAEQLNLLLKSHNIHYLSFGEEFGARRTESEVYSNGKVNFLKVMQMPIFLRGVNRIKDGLAKGFRIALMCTEKDPVDCHRFILVARGIQKKLAIKSSHILFSGELESTESVENRMLNIIKCLPDLFIPDFNASIENAYIKIGEKIAYREFDNNE